MKVSVLKPEASSGFTFWFLSYKSHWALWSTSCGGAGVVFFIFLCISAALDSWWSAFSFIVILRQTETLHVSCWIIYTIGRFRWNAITTGSFYFFLFAPSLLLLLFFRWNMNDSVIINKLNLLRKAYSVEIISTPPRSFPPLSFLVSPA